MPIRLAFLPLVLLLAVPALAQRGDVVYDQSFEFRPGDVLDVATSSPSVVVRTGRQNGAHVRVIGQGPNLREGFEHLRFSASRHRNAVHVRTDVRGQFRLGRVPSFTIEVTVPERADVKVATSSGSIRIENVRGTVDATASSGSVRLARVEGDRVVVRTSSGSVRADQLSGRDRVDVASSSGSIQVDQTSGGTLAFRASSGSVRLGSASGRQVDVRTASGSVNVGTLAGAASLQAGSGSVRVDHVSDRIEVNTGSGSVQLGLQRGVPVRADAGSGSVLIRVPTSARATIELNGGTIQVDDALRIRGEQNRRSYRGTMNGGGDRITVNTGSGRIRLSAS
jgi:DUF4097 and DUF4098 domain-containing protein YvlB